MEASLQKLAENLVNGLHQISCQICKVNVKNAEINVMLVKNKNLLEFKQIEKKSKPKNNTSKYTQTIRL